MTRKRIPFDPDELDAGEPSPVEWKGWMRTLGEQVRRTRIFVGLSQEELARRAGVSQGSVSRLESGRGLATPVLVVARINRVLWRALLAWGPRLNPPLRRGLELEVARDPTLGGPGAKEEDTGLHELVALYERLDETQRAALLVVLQATAEAFATDVPDPARKHKS
jgi:transcriptional regulator with XRE-family HTH domain